MALSFEDQDNLRKKFLEQIKSKNDADFFFEIGEKREYADSLRNDGFFYKEAARVNPSVIESPFFSAFVKQNYEYAAEVYFDAVLEGVYDYDDEIIVRDFPKPHRLFMKQLKSLMHGNESFRIKKTLSVLDDLVKPEEKLEIYKEAVEKYPEVINLIDANKNDANAELVELVDSARKASKVITMKLINKGIHGKELQKAIEKYLKEIATLSKKKQKEISNIQTKKVNDALKR